MLHYIKVNLIFYYSTTKKYIFELIIPKIDWSLKMTMGVNGLKAIERKWWGYKTVSI